MFRRQHFTHSPSPSASYILSVPSSAMFLEPYGGRRGDVSDLFRAEHITGIYS